MGPSYRKALVRTAITRHRRLWANGELPVFSGQPATALQQLKPSMRQKRNALGLCAATGACNPRATHTDGPLTERRLRVQAALAQPPGIEAGCLVSAMILGFLASSPWAHWMRRAFRTRGRDCPKAGFLSMVIPNRAVGGWAASKLVCDPQRPASGPGGQRA